MSPGVNVIRIFQQSISSISYVMKVSSHSLPVRVGFVIWDAENTVNICYVFAGKGILTGRKFLKLSCLIHMMVHPVIRWSPEFFVLSAQMAWCAEIILAKSAFHIKVILSGRLSRERMKCSVSLIRSLIIWRRWKKFILTVTSNIYLAELHWWSGMKMKIKRQWRLNK